MKLRITTSKHNIFLKFNNFNKGLDSRVHFPALVQTRFWSIDFMFAHLNIVSMNIRFNVHYKFIKKSLVKKVISAQISLPTVHFKWDTRMVLLIRTIEMYKPSNLTFKDEYSKGMQF